MYMYMYMYVHLQCNIYMYTCSVTIYFVKDFNSYQSQDIQCTVYMSHVRQLIFLRKSDCLGCALLLCLVVCMTLLASSFLPSLIFH